MTDAYLARKVLIAHDCTDKRPWVAKDAKTGTPLLRLQERYQLEAVFAAWMDVAAPKPIRQSLSNGAPMRGDLARSRVGINTERWNASFT